MSVELQGDEEENRPPDIVLGSILNSIQAADSARERSELIREGLHELARTVIAITLFTLLLCVGIMEFAVGVIKAGSCPINRYIPIWLIVSGAVSCVRNIAGIVFSIMESRNYYEGLLLSSKLGLHPCDLVKGVPLCEQFTSNGARRAAG
ncbi:unnamed protein product [Strongylus vulgaris]|uniref:Uncharacterized protein n=1 Tax=Strongylus vulgaris TaxID=40348 RepID=A0A3P7KB54_STRVU|nr:unnamed protein product [Strongylus vulgaris]